jgi:O-antigen/teichoic acid export membrane protein
LENFFLKAFLASLLMALSILVLALGLIYFFRYGQPLQTPLILVVAALSFVLSASFFERYEVGSMAWSVLVSVIVTIMLTLISGGIVFFVIGSHLSWEDLLSGMAVCVIVSMALLNYLKKSLGEIEA